MAAFLEFPDGLIFYPKHPSDEETAKIQNIPSPMLESQTAPFDVALLCKSIEDDLYRSLAIYTDKRFDVIGVILWTGNDIHNLPAVQLSNRVEGKCCAHCIFPTADMLSLLKPGHQVVIRGNYLVMSNHFGVVMKCCELIYSKEA